jgi:hypothetical protein
MDHPDLRASVERALSVLARLKLLGIGRAADMATMTFHSPDQSDRDLFLHVQCPWRLERDGVILTGRGDLFEPLDPDDPVCLQDPGAYDRYANLQDARRKDFHDEVETGADVARVAAIRVDATGGFEIDLTGGFRIAVFPASSRGECWRLFRRGDERHFVVPPEE